MTAVCPQPTPTDWEAAAAGFDAVRAPVIEQRSGTGHVAGGLLPGVVIFVSMVGGDLARRVFDQELDAAANPLSVEQAALPAMLDGLSDVVA